MTPSYMVFVFSEMLLYVYGIFHLVQVGIHTTLEIMFFRKVLNWK